MEALHVVDAEVAHQLERGLVADHLGDGALAEAARDVDHGLDDELVGEVRDAAAHELAVDLEVVEGEVLEVVERGEGGAEVVEREAAAEPGESVRELLRARDVGHRGRLGDLEDHLRRVDLVRAQLVLDQRQQLGVAGRAAGDVDLEGQPAAAAVLVGQHRDRAGDDPAVDRPDQVVALGGGQEGGRRDQLAERVAQPQQQLELAGVAGREVHDRLRLQDEAVLVEAVADHVRPRDAAVRGGAPGRPVGDRAVAARLLGLVHREVGVGEHVVGAQALFVETGDAEAGADRAQAAGRARDALAADRLEHVLGGLLGVAVGHQDRELVAAEAADRHAVAESRAQRVGQRHDQLVAHPVAERVVDVLEVVEVEHERGAGRPVAADVLEVRLQRAREGAAVEQAGQRVVVGQVAQLGLVAAPLRDVLDLEEDVLRDAGGVAHQRDVHRGPDDRPGRVQPAALAAHRAGVAAREAGERLCLVIAVLGVQEADDGHALELVLRAAGERGQRAVDAQEAAVDGGDRHPDRRLLEGGAETRLGVGLGALGLGAGVDVADRGVDLEQRAGVAHRHEVDLGPAPRAVGATQTHGQRGVLRAGGEVAHGGDRGGGVARVDQIGGARADEGVGREVEQLAAAFGDLADGAVAGDRGQHVAGVVRELARARVGGAAGGLGAVARRDCGGRPALAAAGVDAEPDQRQARDHEPGGERRGRRGDDQQERAGQRREHAEGGSAAAVARGHPPLVGSERVLLKSRAAPPRPARARWCRG